MTDLEGLHFQEENVRTRKDSPKIFPKQPDGAPPGVCKWSNYRQRDRDYSSCFHSLDVTIQSELFVLSLFTL